MKKITVILLSLAMAFCGVLAGCAKQTAGYTAKLYTSDSGYYNADLSEGSDDVGEPADQEMAFSINGDSVKLTYYETIEMPGRHINVYSNEGRTIEVGRYVTTGNTAYVIYSQGDYTISETLTTEAEYRAWAEECLAELMPDEDLSEYEYSFRTKYVHDEGDSSSYPTCDGFYTPQQNEEITSYLIDYTKVFNGYKTADNIGVTIKPYVSDEEPCRIAIVGYSNHDFDNFTAVNLNEQKVKAAIEEKLRSAIKDGNYEFVSCEVKDYTLVYENGTFGVLCGVSTTVKDISGITPEPDYPDDADPTPEHEELSDTQTTYEMVFVTIPTSDYTING